VSVSGLWRHRCSHSPPPITFTERQSAVPRNGLWPLKFESGEPEAPRGGLTSQCHSQS
jgi:hypothetical protein